MEYKILENHCWQGQAGTVHMGAALATEPLEAAGLLCRRLRQVHGALILDDHSFPSQPATGDGLVTDHARVALIIRTADCVPVHLTDGRRIAMVHAGWRSVRAGIIANLAAHFRNGGEAVIGPCISAANYEVNEDLYGDWALEEPGLNHWLKPAPRSDTHKYFDLGGLVRQQLTAAGFQVTVIPVCTFSSGLPSHRKNGTRERIMNYIYRQ